MVSTRNWIAIEYCSSLICASLIHLKPLLERLLPSLLGMSREESNKSKSTSRKSTRISEYAIESRPSTKSKLDTYAQWNTTAVRANRFDDSGSSHDAIKITRGFLITSEPNPFLAVPAKVLHRCKTVIYPRAGIMSPPPSPA